MFLTLAFHHYLFKWLVPISYLAITVPSYLLVYTATKILCTPMPQRHRQSIDNFLFELYFKQILYFLFKISQLKVNH
jgi:hypothetical protein